MNNQNIDFADFKQLSERMLDGRLKVNVVQRRLQSFLSQYGDIKYQ
jgi:hypothetical protein